METSGEFMLELWDWDGNASTRQDGTIRASIPRDEIIAFRVWCNDRGYELTGQQGAPGGRNFFVKIKRQGT